ncbi:RagB/SusD family nutrient uptake outer membrane protein [Mucilaginibacter ginsenosidivorans]|uniref:RagB/SusD family nutrient uptake outer membrane protein n=1 Tax=Mucilaginibacter ginsenosidivorans TaxID=398053 RepID=A0A5B8V0E2_9SPHI|nr:RagB/SusD family nutrient uptake outer membrane protein [Mucilaginibacter ginsenosidivorans]QEC64814.1 RagB/SusD family nutrient uptake outer membrane protein [Mucilaginibacter ginsenosidivorans]
MKVRNIRLLATITVIGVAVTITSCKKNLVPIGQVTTASVYKDFGNYQQVLAKLYTAYALSGQQGPAGNPDIAGIDEGFGNYLREYFNMQELTTDEAQIVWNDGTVHTLHDMTWNNQCEFIRAMYDRIYYEISLDNEFIRNTTDAELAKNGITGSDATTAKQYRAEARFLRALSYWHAIDLFGNVPFVTEADNVGVFFPKQASRTDVFNYIESELKAIDGDLGAPRFSYGHADKAVAWTLLAKLYLNAKVYTGTDRSADAVTYASKVITDGGYTLEPHFKDLFLADNNTSNEIIFPIESDGLHTQGYGGMTYIVHASVGGNMNKTDYGIASGGWAGLRTTPQYVALFPDPSGNSDKRAMFFTDGQKLDIADEYTFNDGYAITKFKNVTKAGVAGSDPTGTFVDTDFPMFRLADVYLMYAEGVLRGGGGDLGTALTYVNMVRTRAYDGDVSGDITAGQLTLPFILDERGRELLFEGHRRTDLIRFNKFTSGDYTWQWKGATHNGTGVEDYRNLMPIPSTDIINNPTLKQNPGYN